MKRRFFEEGKQFQIDNDYSWIHSTVMIKVPFISDVPQTIFSVLYPTYMYRIISMYSRVTSKRNGKTAKSKPCPSSPKTSPQTWWTPRGWRVFKAIWRQLWLAIPIRWHRISPTDLAHERTITPQALLFKCHNNNHHNNNHHHHNNNHHHHHHHHIYVFPPSVFCFGTVS